MPLWLTSYFSCAVEADEDFSLIIKRCLIGLQPATVVADGFPRCQIEEKIVQRANNFLRSYDTIRERAALVRASGLRSEHAPVAGMKYSDRRGSHLKNPSFTARNLGDIAQIDHMFS